MYMFKQIPMNIYNISHLMVQSSPKPAGAPGANGVFGQIGAEAHELRQRGGQLPSNGPCDVETMSPVHGRCPKVSGNCSRFFSMKYWLVFVGIPRLSWSMN